ncbi:hypothetical protein [Flagellimonas sp.]|uniref:hypothetical protein n=1 Tax=Flagellimonas sp. TaxID=2058762 RepID=UPI003BACBE3D
MEHAAFRFDSYKFDRVDFNYHNLGEGEIDVRFEPSGIFNNEKKQYTLRLIFFALSDKDKFIEIESNATFSFTKLETFDDIPSFFYRNAIAIFFPYLRAYISLVTNQANHPAFILPTLNLSKLEIPLKENTEII